MKHEVDDIINECESVSSFFFQWACCGTVQTCVIELCTSSDILSEILIMPRKSNSNPSAKSLQEENAALKKEIESLKSEFQRVSSVVKCHESLNGWHKPHPDMKSAQTIQYSMLKQRIS